MRILALDGLNTFFEEAKRSGVFELYCIDLFTGLQQNGAVISLKTKMPITTLQ